MMRYKTFIFDLDGTLLNTLDDLAASTNYALRQFEMKEHPVESIRQFVGNGVGKLIERAIPDGKDNPLYDDVLDTFRKHYMNHSLDTTRPYDGVDKMLRDLKQSGCRIAVVSNKFLAATQELCQHFFPDTVEVAIGEHENIRRKPAPDTVREALQRLGEGSDDAVYVGDSEVDIATAKNSGLPCISVLWGFRDRDFLLSHGATTFVTTPSDIVSIYGRD
ncbi:MAG: HAD family hydrolase [Prevotella sp.]|nr:HAD family hydrolase [Prevotella sp.]